MFFRETREKEVDIRRIFCEAREKMRRMITLKKKSDPGQFAIPCTVEPSQELFTFVDCSQKSTGGIVRDLEVQIGNALVPVDFHVFDIKLNWNSSLLLGKAFLSTVGAVCNLQTNQLCLTLIDPNVNYDLIPVKKPQTISRRINDPGIIAGCHCGDEYETEYSESIETHTATSIAISNQKSTDIPHDKSVDSNPNEWENDYYNPTIDAYTRQNMHTDEYDEDYEEERAIEYRAILDEEDKLLHHSSWKRTAPSIDRTSWPSIDTQPRQRCRKGASTDTAYYKSIHTDCNRVRDGDYSFGSWADEHHHESFAVETATYTPGADKLQDSFTDEELLNMQKRDDTDQIQAEVAWERTQSIDTRHQPSINKLTQQSIDINNTTSIDNHSIPKTTVKREDQIPRQLFDYIMVEGNKQHGSEELSRAEEAETSYPTSASITTTTSTSIDTSTATSIDGTTSTSTNVTTSTSINDSTLKSIDISSCDPTPNVEKEITMEDFLELEEFLELEDGEKLEDLDSSREVIMEDFLELEEWFEDMDQNSKKKLDDDQHTSRGDLETSPKASIDRHQPDEIDQQPPYIIDQRHTVSSIDNQQIASIYTHTPSSIGTHPIASIDTHGWMNCQDT
ncbi:hypothetical protein F2Q70_00025966 [Brassica cretica]|uniref:Aspartic peptidase DDI1-type domain-containing protein n=1 Tax=Brassica cretica TaxID=69181 RepID=A0A8S9LBJ8_BRACR|nr:hypothetical protein F2Q70_00025966 [Brassica cretica]